MAKDQDIRTQADKNIMEVVATEYLDRHRAYLRLVTAGNAGGLIATLSVLGGIMGTAPGEPLPLELIYIVGVYFVGLFGSLIATMADIWMAEVAVIAQLKRLETGVLDQRDIARFKSERRYWKYGAFISLVFFAIGSFWGLALLERLTG